jgi:hypothetical protein
MQRRVVKLGVFLLLGAIINVAVAWGCASHSPAETQFDLSRHEWPRATPNNWPANPDYGWQFVGWGMTVLISDGHGPEPIGRWNGDVYEGSWNRDLYRFAWFTSGWPMCSMHWSLYDMLPDARGTLDHWPDQTHGWLRSGFHAPTVQEDEWRFQRRLPVALLWPGFVINTFFYGAVLSLFFTAPVALRRRSRTRRGLCPACGYPVGTSVVCTECGGPVRRCEGIAPQASLTIIAKMDMSR